MLTACKEVINTIEAATVTSFLVFGTSYISETDLLQGIEGKRDRTIVKEAINELFFVFYTKVKKEAVRYPTRPEFIVN
jgi:hypothetical protein